MMDGTAIRALNAWCGTRALSWSAAHPLGGCDVMMLMPRDAERPWQRMMLVLDSSELRLENEEGETLASASSLPALLDAVDGGVAEPPPPPSRALAGHCLPLSEMLFVV